MQGAKAAGHDQLSEVWAWVGIRRWGVQACPEEPTRMAGHPSKELQMAPCFQGLIWINAQNGAGAPEMGSSQAVLHRVHRSLYP